MTWPEPERELEGLLALAPRGVELLAVLEEHADVVDRRLLAALDLGAVAGDQRLGLQRGRRGAGALGHLGLGVDVGLARGRRRPSGAVGAVASGTGFWFLASDSALAADLSAALSLVLLPQPAASSASTSRAATGMERVFAKRGIGATLCRPRRRDGAPPPASRLDAGAKASRPSGRSTRAGTCRRGSSAPSSPCSSSASPCTRRMP